MKNFKSLYYRSWKKAVKFQVDIFHTKLLICCTVVVSYQLRTEKWQMENILYFGFLEALTNVALDAEN